MGLLNGAMCFPYLCVLEELPLLRREGEAISHLADFFREKGTDMLRHERARKKEGKKSTKKIP